MGGAPSKSSSVAGGGHSHPTRFIVTDPAVVRMLATVVPCDLCTDGLCWRCWTVARAVEQLTIAGRRDQAADALEAAA